MKTEALFNSCQELAQRGVKVRCLTAITKENLRDCKKIAEVCELRHVEGLDGFLGIADSRRFLSYAPKNNKARAEQLKSTSKTFIQLQEHFFEAIWSKAILAKVRISQIEDEIEPEITEVITGWENITKNSVEAFKMVKDRVDSCCDALIPPIIVGSPMHKASADFVKRGGRVRLITEITSENLSSVKELLKTQEIRHINGFKLNFGVSHFGFLAPTSVYSMSSEPQCLWSNSKSIISQHQYLFDGLWNSAIPAEVRIREIELGIAPDVIETLNDPDRIQKLVLKIVANAKKEILIIFASASAFMLQERAGLIQLIENRAKDSNIIVRIIAPVNGRVRELINRWNNLNEKAETNHVAVRNIEASMQTKVSIVVVDKSYSLAIELKDVSADSNHQGIGLATYSNSKPTVLSYVSIFDTIWAQADLYEEIRQLYEQLQIQEKQQREFINIAAHEFRSPLEPILGLAKVLRRHSRDIQSQQLLEVIIRNAQRLQHLQEEILDVTRIERQLMELEREEFDLNSLITQVIDDFRRQEELGGPEIVLLCECKGSIPILADRVRITQVISNLLSNAVKFTKKGTILVKSEKSSDGMVIVSVTDTGQGIDSKMFPKLFTKFSSKSPSGTGLGLYISRAIVEAHMGKMWAENNQDGKGATFHFALPRANEFET